MEYRNKLNEAKFNLKALQEKFDTGEEDFVHPLNNFLSSAQSVFWILNKELNKVDGYSDWAEERGSRLSDDAKIFKELRNVSLKEKPIKHEGKMLGFDFGSEGILLSSKETLTMPFVNIQTGEFASNKAVIESPDGNAREVEIEVFNDFSVKVESDGKVYSIDRFIKSAKRYLGEIETEIDVAEQKFLSSVQKRAADD